ncbi:MAG: phosphotransferase family protein [Candidatus Limnocylindrales bacterium]
MPVDDLRLIGAGLSSAAWFVRSGDRRLALRIATEPAAPLNRYAGEHAILARLVTRGVLVPEPVTGSWEIARWPGPSFSLTTFLAGVPLQPAALESAAGEIATFLVKLRSVPTIGFGPIGPLSAGEPVQGIATDPISGLGAWMAGAPLWPFDQSRLEAHPALIDRAALRSEIARWRSTIESAGRTRPAVLVHSDLHEENILDTRDRPDGRRLAFIDFGEAFIGAAGWDEAALAYFLGWPLADRVHVLAGTGRAASRSGPRSIAALGVSFGLYRWWQDRQRDVDDNVHAESFLRSALDRLRR